MKKIIFIVLSIFLLFSVMAENTPDPYAILDVLQKQYSYDDQDYSATVTLIVEKPNQPAEQLQFKLFKGCKKAVYDDSTFTRDRQGCWIFARWR